MGFLDRLGLGKLQAGLAKTRDTLVTRVARLVTARGKIDDAFLDELEEILISADVGVETTGEIISGLRRRAKDERYESADELLELVRKELVRTMGPPRTGEGDPFAVPGQKPYVLVVVGINGVGKTTTIGKLAHVYRNAGKSVVIGAADTFRAAANEQLEIWAQRSGARIIQHQQGGDPAAVAFDTVRSAMAQQADVVIIDTAGRLHTKINLMEELKKIRRVIENACPGAPHEVLLVIDASTGQNGMVQAKQFSAAVGVTGLVLTKLDGSARGGVVLAIARELQVPVRFIGVGEGLEDLQPFDRAAFVDALFAKGEPTP